jgi:hypothetical protein
MFYLIHSKSGEFIHVSMTGDNWHYCDRRQAVAFSSRAAALHVLDFIQTNAYAPKALKVERL